jgi:hypothetical protein
MRVQPSRSAASQVHLASMAYPGPPLLYLAVGACAHLPHEEPEMRVEVDIAPHRVCYARECHKKLRVPTVVEGVEEGAEVGDGVDDADDLGGVDHPGLEGGSVQGGHREHDSIEDAALVGHQLRAAKGTGANVGVQG